MVDLNELKDSVFLEDFSESELESLESIAVLSHWREGETVFCVRSPGTHFYILNSGTILLHFPNGRSFPLRDQGQTIGWSSLLSPFFYTATGLCLTNVSLYQFPRTELFGLIQMNADFGYRLMNKIAQITGERKPYRRFSAPIKRVVDSKR